MAVDEVPGLGAGGYSGFYTLGANSLTTSLNAAASFSRSQSAVVVPIPEQPQSAPFTVEAWVKPADATLATQTILETGGDGSLGFDLSLHGSDTGTQPIGVAARSTAGEWSQRMLRFHSQRETLFT